MVASSVRQPTSPVRAGWPWRLWGTWIIANALAELIGLGASSLLWLLFFFGMESYLGILLSALIVVIGSTLLEGSAVGIGQWLVLRQRLPALTLRSWWIATGIGALAAWTFGMIPSTMMAFGAETTPAGPPPELSDALTYTLAALMGLVLGPVLALPQWWVLCRYVDQAWPWIGANALAWALGMPVIFGVMGLIPSGAVTVWTVVIVLCGLALAGAVVGAVHGTVLVWLLARKPQT